MAFVLTKDTRYGVQASYHKIDNYSVDFFHGIFSVNFSSYASKEARLAGAAPLSQSTVAGKLDQLQAAEVSREVFYNFARDLAEFSGAVDDL